MEGQRAVYAAHQFFGKFCRYPKSQFTDGDGLPSSAANFLVRKKAATTSARSKGTVAAFWTGCFCYGVCPRVLTVTGAVHTSLFSFNVLITVRMTAKK